MDSSYFQHYAKLPENVCLDQAGYQGFMKNINPKSNKSQYHFMMEIMYLSLAEKNTQAAQEAFDKALRYRFKD